MITLVKGDGTDLGVPNTVTIGKVGAIKGSYYATTCESKPRTFWEPEIVRNYTETDPNIHSINFIYKINYPSSVYNPSVFVLFNNQMIKKAFLKEEITID